MVSCGIPGTETWHGNPRAFPVNSSIPWDLAGLHLIHLYFSREHERLPVGTGGNRRDLPGEPKRSLGISRATSRDAIFYSPTCFLPKGTRAASQLPARNFRCIPFRILWVPPRGPSVSREESLVPSIYNGNTKYFPRAPSGFCGGENQGISWYPVGPRGVSTRDFPRESEGLPGEPKDSHGIP